MKNLTITFLVLLGAAGPLAANVVTNGDFSASRPPWVFFSNGAHALNVIGAEAQIVVTL